MTTSKQLRAVPPLDIVNTSSGPLIRLSAHPPLYAQITGQLTLAEGEGSGGSGSGSSGSVAPVCPTTVLEIERDRCEGNVVCTDTITIDFMGRPVDVSVALGCGSGGSGSGGSGSGSGSGSESCLYSWEELDENNTGDNSIRGSS